MLKLSQIAAYEQEISKLREELLKEIGHLEERKEEAVKAAASCSAEHFQNLQDQFFSELHCIIKGLWFLNTRKRNTLNTFIESKLYSNMILHTFFFLQVYKSV